MNETPSQTKSKTQWAPIIQDFIILMCVMGLLGYLCKLAMAPFEVQTPTDSLVSLIRKGAVKAESDGLPQDVPFCKELDAVCISAEHGVNTADSTGRTPLMWAVYANFNNPEAAREVDAKRLYYVFALLKAPGIDLNLADKDGFTALHWAAWSGMRYNLTLLARAGMDVNARENAGYTPLMLAAMRGNDETVAALLALGADPSISRENGSTAASLAAEAKASYDKRNNMAYSLIYETPRAAAYAQTVALLNSGKATTAPMTNDELHQIMLNTVKTEPAKQDAEKAETAQEEKIEQDIEKGAAAPPNTDADQAPSAHVE